MKDSKCRKWGIQVYWLMAVLYWEILTHAGMYDQFHSSFLYALAFSAAAALLLGALISSLPPKAILPVSVAVSVGVMVLYGSQMVYSFIFGTPYSVSQIGLGADAVTSFWREMLQSMRENLVWLLGLLAPFALLILLHRRKAMEKPNRIQRACAVAAGLALVAISWGSIRAGGTGMYSTYYFFCDSGSTTSQTMERFGVPTTFLLEYTRPESDSLLLGEELLFSMDELSGITELSGVAEPVVQTEPSSQTEPSVQTEAAIETEVTKTIEPLRETKEIKLTEPGVGTVTEKETEPTETIKAIREAEPTEAIRPAPTTGTTESAAGTEASTPVFVEVFAKEPSEESSGAPAEVLAEEPAEESTEVSSEEVTEKATEELTVEPTEEITEEPTEEVTEKATEEETEDVTEEPTEETVPEEEQKPSYNVMDIDFERLAQETNSSRLAALHRCFSQLPASNQNEFTGIFRDYNLIVICAESFSPAALDPEITPTLYKMAHEGFVFNNYYNSFPNTTTNGEYALTQGLFPDSTRDKYNSSMRASYKNTLPFTLGNAFSQQLGVTSRGYHNYLGDYYSRYLTHPNMGYEMKFNHSGMELSGTWPNSDLEMMEASVDDYIHDSQFNVYYMTFSGHYQYNSDVNAMVAKNYDLVEDIPGYSMIQKGYLACHIELDKAMEYLISRLEEEGIADKTLIVMASDHYPYGIPEEDYFEMLGEPKDLFGKYKSTLIFWVDGMEPMEVDEYCCNVDILPTLLNMWGLEYDSRLLSGTDIFSDSFHMAVLIDRSFLTDLVWFNPNRGEIRYLVEESLVPEGYIDSVNKLISTRFELAKEIVKNDYYSLLFPES